MTKRKSARAVPVLTALAIGIVALSAAPAAASPVHGVKTGSAAPSGTQAHRLDERYRPHASATQPQGRLDDAFPFIWLG
jgi:hypothetical protein